MPARLPRYVATLVLMVVALVTTATAQRSRNGRGDGDLKEIENYRLTTTTLSRMAQVQENMYAVMKANPGLADRGEDPAGRHHDDDESLDGMAKKFDRIPQMRGAIVKAGFTPREYMLATMAMMQAGMNAMLMETPGVDQSKIAPGVKANVAFLKAHKTEMDRMQARTKEIERLSKPAGADPDRQSADTTGAIERAP